MRTARLISLPAAERVEVADGPMPVVGDRVVLDHGFTFPDGRSGGMVVGLAADGRVRYYADLYDDEIDDVRDE
jgi:hypothetical protein